MYAWIFPALVWMLIYPTTLIEACSRTMFTGRPYWTAGISYTASLQVSEWFNLTYNNYNVALINTLIHFLLVGLLVICKVAVNKDLSLPVHHETGTNPLSLDFEHGAYGWRIQPRDSSDPIEIGTTEPSNSSNDHPPIYSEVEQPPKYEDCMTPV